MTGPSGAGKGTLIERVLPRFPELALAVSATTRPQRPGEEDGAHYYFLTREEFDRRIEAGDFLEWVDYVGNRYGTLLSEINRLRAGGNAPLLELETEGALRVKRKIEGAVTIFVTAPVAELERRLRERATESTGEIEGRVEMAHRQQTQGGEFDHILVNDDLENATAWLTGIVERELATATIPSS